MNTGTVGSFSAREDEVIRQCANTGGSFSTAAELLGRTRSMIAGRAHRLGVRFVPSFEKSSRAGKRAMEKRWGSRR